MKSYTDLEQSKKLAEFLPLESADMYWSIDEIPFLAFPVNDIVTDWEYAEENGMLPAWSLAALLDVLPNGTDICKNIEGRYYVHGFFSDNSVDACVDAIKALHELNLL